MRRLNYKDRRQFLLSIDREDLEVFQKICDNERKSMSFKLNELVQEEIQKNELGCDNPIGINFNQTNKSVHRKPTMEDYIQQAQIAETEEQLDRLKSIAKHKDQEATTFLRTITRRKVELGLTTRRLGY